jgi:hypothetical protein
MFRKISTTIASSFVTFATASKWAPSSTLTMRWVWLPRFFGTVIVVRTRRRCENPPVLVGLWRETKRVVKFRYNRMRYILTTTREQRGARTAKIEAAKARIAARRAGVES